MSTHGVFWAGIFDGVSGVPPPMLPEDLSWELREWVRYLLRQRFKFGQDVRSFGAEVVCAIGGSLPDTSKDPPGAWLARLVHLALQSTQLFGSTCVALATLIGRRFTIFTLGDSQVQIFRFNHCVGMMQVVMGLQCKASPLQLPVGRQ